MIISDDDKKLNLKEFCLKVNREDLLSEWNEKKNQISPCDIRPNSHNKVWWICKKGHEWETNLRNRTVLDSGCPYCSGLKTIVGENDLATLYPELLVEWDYSKNDVEPQYVKATSSRKAWWKCSLGHEWETNVSTRTVMNCGCPYCSNRSVLYGYNDLESWCLKNNREFLAREFDEEKNGFTAKEIVYGSGKSVWWRCSKNHTWKASVYDRTIGKHGCLLCSKSQTSFPEQAIAFYLSKFFQIIQRYKIRNREVDVFIPEYSIAIEYDGIFFHSDIVTKQREEAKNILMKENGINLIRIKESSDKQEIVGNVIYFIVKQKGKYVEENFEWAIYRLFEKIEEISKKRLNLDINISRDELDILAHYHMEEEQNSVAALYPEVAKEWNIVKNGNVDASAYSAHNGTYVWWKCSKGHEWRARIISRTARGLGCPYCAGQKPIKGKNDLKSWCEENSVTILEEWNFDKNDTLPSEYARTSGKKVWWKCAKGHEWEASIANRVKGNMCPFCHNGSNSSTRGTSLYKWCIDNNRADLISEWNTEKNSDKTMDDFTYGSHKKVWWKCQNGHEWEAEIKHRTKVKTSCPFCRTYNTVVPGKNDLETWCRENNNEDILLEWNFERNTISPNEVSRASHKKVWWKCRNGHEWECEVKYRTASQGNRCPICKK